MTTLAYRRNRESTTSRSMRDALLLPTTQADFFARGRYINRPRTATTNARSNPSDVLKVAKKALRERVEIRYGRTVDQLHAYFKLPAEAHRPGDRASEAHSHPAFAHSVPGKMPIHSASKTKLLTEASSVIDRSLGSRLSPRPSNAAGVQTDRRHCRHRWCFLIDHANGRDQGTAPGLALSAGNVC